MSSWQQLLEKCIHYSSTFWQSVMLCYSYNVTVVTAVCLRPTCLFPKLTKMSFNGLKHTYEKTRMKTYVWLHETNLQYMPYSICDYKNRSFKTHTVLVVHLIHYTCTPSTRYNAIMKRRIGFYFVSHSIEKWRDT
jgi:hypothetical protein